MGVCSWSFLGRMTVAPGVFQFLFNVIVIGISAQVAGVGGEAFKSTGGWGFYSNFISTRIFLGCSTDIAYFAM